MGNDSIVSTCSLELFVAIEEDTQNGCPKASRRLSTGPSGWGHRDWNRCVHVKKKNTKVLPKIVFTLMQSTLLYSSICILTWIERRISCDTEVTVSANSLMPQLRFHCCVCWMNALLCIRRFEFQKVVCGGKCCVITSNNISITSHTTIFWYQAVAVT